MCAWWTGQPVYGSNPASKFVRENFAWIKALIDQHEIIIGGSGVTQADMTKLHTIAATAAQVDRNASLPVVGELGTILDSAGVKIINLGFNPSVVIFICVHPSGEKEEHSWGFDDGTNHVCTYTWLDISFQSSYIFTESIVLTHAGGTPTRTAHITNKSATGFSLTVAAVGAGTWYKGIYLALP